MSLHALVLAAGRGSRMGKATEHQPKCLVEVNGRSLLSYQLEALKQGGCDSVGLVSGYCREQLVDYFDAEFHNADWSSTNMVASLLCASSWLENSTCIVSYSDLFYFDDAIKALSGSDADINVLYDQNWYELWSSRFDNPLDDAETFITNSQGFLTEIGQKTNDVARVQGQYMGLFKLTPTGWKMFVEHANKLFSSRGHNIYITDVLQSIAKQHTDVIKTVPFCGTWGEVDSESDRDFYNKRELKPLV